jgi:hypothetical protein
MHLTSTPDRVDEAVRRILSEAHDGIERRDAKRSPFFRPARIGLNRQQPCLSAIVRDLSPTGIGLLHAMPLGRDEISVAIRSKKSGEVTTLQARLDWCESFGEGWYISGGHFLGVVQSAENRHE